MLFTVNKSPFTTDNLSSCLKFAKSDTPILLYEDGVYAAQAGTKLETAIKEAASNLEIYALKEDLQARGIDKLIDGIKTVDYSGFVDLVEKHHTCHWI